MNYYFITHNNEVLYYSENSSISVTCTIRYEVDPVKESWMNVHYSKNGNNDMWTLFVFKPVMFV